MDSAPVALAFAGTTLSRASGTGARRTGRQSLLGLSVVTHAQGGRGKIRKRPLGGGSGASKRGKAKRGASQGEKVRKAVRKSVAKPKTVKTAPAFPTSPSTKKKTPTAVVKKKKSAKRPSRPTAASKPKPTNLGSRKSTTVKVTRKRSGGAGSGSGSGSGSSSSLGLLGASVFAALAIISGSSGVAAPAKKAPSNDLGINFAELIDTSSTSTKAAAPKSAPSVSVDSSEITSQQVAIDKVKKKSAKASQARIASTVTNKDSVKVASQKNAVKKRAAANQEKQKKLQKQASNRRDQINKEANRRELARKGKTQKILANRAKARKALITKRAKFNPTSLKKKKESGLSPAAFIFAAIGGGAVGLTLLPGNDNKSKNKDAVGSATTNGAEAANVAEAKNWVQRWRSRRTSKKKESSSSTSAPGLPPIDSTAAAAAVEKKKEEEEEVAPSDPPTVE